MDTVSNAAPTATDAGAASGESFEAQLNAAATAQDGGFVSISEQGAEMQLIEIARQPGNSALKMQLAQEGISLTDNSDVGQGERFDSVADKFGYVMNLKMKLLIAITTAMISSGGWGPSDSAEIAEARAALRGT